MATYTGWGTAIPVRDGIPDVMLRVLESRNRDRVTKRNTCRSFQPQWLKKVVGIASFVHLLKTLQPIPDIHSRAQNALPQIPEFFDPLRHRLDCEFRGIEFLADV